MIASFTSYAVEKKLSKHPEKFGTGAIEGLAGPETANNAGASGAFVPLLTLGIPSSGIMALLLGFLLTQGVHTGPLLLKDHADIFWGVITSMYIGNIMLLILNLPMIGIWVKILKVPYRILAPMILLFCVIGSFSLSNNSVDVVTMVTAGIMGYIFKKMIMMLRLSSSPWCSVRCSRTRCASLGPLARQFFYFRYATYFPRPPPYLLYLAHLPSLPLARMRKKIETLESDEG